jgi:hypothetical protein
MKTFLTLFIILLATMAHGADMYKIYIEKDAISEVALELNTNFEISKGTMSDIQTTPGVEIHSQTSRYTYCLYRGVMFTWDEVITNLAETLVGDPERDAIKTSLKNWLVNTKAAEEREAK